MRKKNKRLIIIAILVPLIAFASTIINQYLDTPLRNSSNYLSGVYICPSDYQLTVDRNGKHVCVSCPKGGDYNTNSYRCEASPNPSCSMQGYVYNPNSNMCEGSPNQAQCPNGGVWDNSAKICVGTIGIVKNDFSFENSGVISYGRGTSFEIRNDGNFIGYTTTTDFKTGTTTTTTTTIPILNGSGSFYLGYPAYSDGDFRVYLYINTGNFAIYTEEDDSGPEWSGWFSIFNRGGNYGVSDAWFFFDGLGHFAFRDRKGYDSGLRPLFCPLNSVWNGSINNFQCLICQESGYSYNTSRGRCESPPICNSGYSYNTSLGLCERCLSTNFKGVCVSWDRYDPANNCQPPAILSGNRCLINPIFVCPTDYTLSGGICVANPNVIDATFTK